MTMNVLAPEYADGAGRRAVLARELAGLAPDVLALQEVTRADVAALAGDGWHVLPHPRYGSDGVGAVLAARTPFAAVAADPLTVSDRTARTEWCGVVAALLPLPEPFGPLLVGHHKPSWPYGWELEREQQALVTARLLAERAEEHSARHTLLLGDFDATPDAASIRFLRGFQSLDGTSVCYQDAWASAHPEGASGPGPTFTPENPLVRRGDMPEAAERRLDYILVGCGPHGPTLHVTGCRRVMVEPVDGVQVSDHYGLVADLVPPDHPPGAWAD
ncbi:endonuclease/exonuclease/phosphatase family protein [Streptomyces tubbatahanensis]|uniref:Endonuclease/exonuclease/phosphatase family protein n=1 Tax=Streptomyces tubbatahanensis TaxID=2923272 RepID=A0ABY3XPU0_9ACTN|nr:endonuclease/exonuclease/phosphatase family protein [Streptomyces tubbatahanensis]UNS96411.1 endonuclease/exonuclease/phosphatase family protein [Streptomyces tubbatahanensis]